MNFKPVTGSVVYGAAGIGCKVLEIEGDTLIIQTNKGIRRIAVSWDLEKRTKVSPKVSPFSDSTELKEAGEWDLEKNRAIIEEAAQKKRLVLPPNITFRK